MPTGRGDAIQDAVAAKIQDCDPQQRLSSGDFQDVLFEVSDALARMDRDSQIELNDEDRAFISLQVGEQVQAFLDQYEAERSKPTRFKKFERVVCRIGGQRGWASGKIQSVKEDDPEDPTGQTKLPYVVKIDPPNGRLISVPKDNYSVCRTEVCFGQLEDSLWFTLCCLPQQPGKAQRFGVGERVACAIEDATEDYSTWAAGTVLGIDYSIEDDAKALPDGGWKGKCGCVPYRVELDVNLTVVLVHRDVHWLVRDLSLQAEGPRQEAGSKCCLTRLETRRRDDGWVVIDHETRRVQPCQEPWSDDEENI